MDPQASLVLNNGDQGQEHKRRRMNVEPTGDQHAQGAPREALPGEPDMADHPGPTALDLAASGAAAGLVDEDVTKQEPGTSVFVVPAFAGWFRWDKVHPLERKAVPEFFGQVSTAGHVDAFAARRVDGDGEQGGAERTPELFLEYRNSIINLYRARPSSTLSFTQVRRCLVGDVVALRRIFNMLNQWGIINSLVQPLIGGEAGALDAKGMRVSSSLIIPTTNGTQLKGSATLLAPPPATPLIPSRQTSAANSQQVRAILAAETSLSAALYPHPTSSPSVGPSTSGADEGIAGLDSAPSLHTAPQVACNSCSGPCTPCYYTALRKEDCHLCSKCFAAGRFVEGLGELDFVLVVQSSTTAQGDSVTGKPGLGNSEAEEAGYLGEAAEGQWTEEELLLLLEAVEIHTQNWAQIAAHVGTKNAQQCVLQFVRLPIQETLLEEQRHHSVDSAKGLGEQQLEVRSMKSSVAIGADSRLADTGTGSSSVDKMAPSLVQPVGGLLGTIDGQDRMPFMESGNPVMAQLTFISAMLGSRVASIGSQAAMAVLCYDEPELLDELQSGAGENKGTASTKSAPSFDMTILKTRAACAAAFAAASVKAKLVAEQEEHHIRSLLGRVVECQLKKIGFKLAHFYKVEKVFEKELVELNTQRQLLMAERIRLGAKDKALSLQVPP